MRGYYLNRSANVDRGCRGGVGSKSDGDYELEIGHAKNCSPEMMAICVHYDEIIEYLELNNESSIAIMILRSIKNTTERIYQGFHENSTV